MLKYTLIFLLIVGFYAVVQPGFTEGDPVGKAVIEITAGQRGDVTFPHETHQKTLKDCNICHSLFPKKEKVIQEMKAKNTLKKKQVMANCLSCHRAKKKEGLKTGPTSCSKCHKK